MKKIFLFILVILLTGQTVYSQNETKADKPIKARVFEARSWNLGELMAGPSRGQDRDAWLAGMRIYRQEIQGQMKKAAADFSDPYAEPALLWTQQDFVQPQMMAHDRYFYDPESGHYTVQRYLKDLDDRYGGIESVLVWPTYPNIGIDNRNQFDLWRDMPGGIAGLKEMVDAFHRQGVRVFIPIMYWDHGTRDEGVPMEQGLAELARDMDADGFNGDTMRPVGIEFYKASLKVGHPIAIEPEVGLDDKVEALAWNVMSWGYWGPYQTMPAVDRYKWIEPRHMTHVCDRWAHDRTDMLQYAFFNGSGYQSWENVWGIWNGMTERDAFALRHISSIYRAVPELLISADYEPYYPTLHLGVYATEFPGQDATLWTVVNRFDQPYTGEQMTVPYSRGMHYYNLWTGAELKPVVDHDQATLAFYLEPHGFAAVLATASGPSESVQKLLSEMKKSAHTKLTELSAKWSVLDQQIVGIPKTKAVATAPKGMVLVPADSFSFKADGVMIERSEGVGVQYPWEAEPSMHHQRKLFLKSFYIDKTPVTCAEFKRFLDDTHYQPKDDHNFLKNWTNGSFPKGWDKKPVTWVSLKDARAYAKWAGKRLPHEWEWQYAAQGTDGRLYPWGNDLDESRMPPFDRSREQRPPTDVDAYPQGASPFGVVDMVGNVWQWTDEYRDEHTRAAILKGGSYYRPETSHWYFPQAHELHQHGKYLLLAPSIDRSATIGFRCVVDAE